MNYTRRLNSDDGRSWATFSLFKTHRYALGRDWSTAFDPEPRTLVAVGINPSKAGVDDDQTIRKEIGFAKRLGCVRLVKFNLYGLISTDAKASYLLEHPDPVGSSDQVIRDEVENLDVLRVVVLAAWGSHPMATRERIAAVTALLPVPLMCLGTCADGQPRHPSRIAYATPLVPWKGL